MEIKTVAVALLAIVSIFFLYYFLAPQEMQKATYQDFVLDLMAAKKVYIYMDLRNANESARNPILQCGVDLAQSTALGSKSLIVLAADEKGCIVQDTAGNYSSTYSSFYCDELVKNNGVLFHIIEGNSTIFYKNRIEIGLENYSVACKVS